MSPEAWRQFRYIGLGGSDIPALLGISAYKTQLELYLEKIGEYDPFVKPNRFTEFGDLHEPEIAGLYQYWDGDVESMFENRNAGRKINRVRSVHAYILNEKYPQLFSSIDRLILSKKSKSTGTGVLECKNIASYRLKQFADDIPYEHISQLMGYLLNTEYEYGVLAMEVDGNDYQVYQYSRNDQVTQEFMEKIEEQSSKLWINVLKARKIKQEFGIRSYYDMHPSLIEQPHIQEAVAMLQELEPPITPDKSLEAFLNKLYKPEPIAVPGTNEQWELAVKYNQCTEQVKKAEDDKRSISNQIKSQMKNVEKIDFPENGSITWKADKKGVRRFSVNIRN